MKLMLLVMKKNKNGLHETAFEYETTIQAGKLALEFPSIEVASEKEDFNLSAISMSIIAQPTPKAVYKDDVGPVENYNPNAAPIELPPVKGNKK